jgi:AraC-like DNA-binding protein
LNESDVEADIYLEWAPPPAWRSVVACCWEQRVIAGRVQRVLPDGCADLLVDESGRIEVVGVSDAVALPLLAPGSWTRGIRLRPEAVGRTLGAVASALRNATVPLGDVVGSRRARALSGDRAIDAWIRGVEPDGRARAAVRLLADHDVEGVAGRIGLSPRQLHRLFLAEVGINPKTFQRVARLRRFLAFSEAGSSLAAAAAGAGYADQPHLTRDVHRLSGLAPAALLAERGVTV